MKTSKSNKEWKRIGSDKPEKTEKARVDGFLYNMSANMGWVIDSVNFRAFKK